MLFQNLELHRLRPPLSGVFLVEVSGLPGQPLPGVANIGTRPTVNDSIKANLEVHLLNFDSNIYGHHIEVTFREKLRDERKFDSVEELKAQIQQDIASAREYFQLSPITDE